MMNESRWQTAAAVPISSIAVIYALGTAHFASYFKIFGIDGSLFPNSLEDVLMSRFLCVLYRNCVLPLSNYSLQDFYFLIKLWCRLKWLKPCGSGLRGRVVKRHESGMSKEKIASILITWSGVLSRLAKKCKESGDVWPCERTKCRAKKFSGDALLGHVLKNFSEAIEGRAHLFSAKGQSVYESLH